MTEKERKDREMVVQFSIITKTDWYENAEKAIEIMEKSQRTFPLTQNHEFVYQIGVSYKNGKEKILTITPKKWENVKEEIRQGNIQSISLFIWPKNGFTLHPPMCIQFIKPSQFFEGISKEMNDIQHFVIPWKKDDACTNRMVALFKELFVSFDGIYGYLDYIYGVSIAAIINPTEYEIVNKINYANQNSQKYDHLARGYYWGNILTEKHIEALGGEEAFAANVPHHILEKLPMKDGRLAYYIQLTPNVFFFEPEKYLALKDYLKPILPPENIGYTLFVDPDGERRKRNRLVYHPGELEAAQPEADKLFAAEEERRRKWKEAGGMAQFAKPPYVRFKRQRESDPSYLEITVKFETLSEEQGEQLKKLIDDWYAIGSFNGFDGPFHMQFSLWQDGTSIGTAIDAASVNGLNQALKVLERVINDFANSEGLRIKKAEVGSFEDKET